MTNFTISLNPQDYIKIHTYLKEGSSFLQNISVINDYDLDEETIIEEFNEDFIETKKAIELDFKQISGTFFSTVHKVTSYSWLYRDYDGLLSRNFAASHIDPINRRNKIVLPMDDSLDYSFIISAHLLQCHFFDMLYSFRKDKVKYNNLIINKIVDIVTYLVLFETELENLYPASTKTKQYAAVRHLPHYKEIERSFKAREKFLDFLSTISRFDD